MLLADLIILVVGVNHLYPLHCGLVVTHCLCYNSPALVVRLTLHNLIGQDSQGGGDA